jgi:hypothetical protein
MTTNIILIFLSGVVALLVVRELQRSFNSSRYSPPSPDYWRRNLTEEDHQNFLRAWNIGAGKKTERLDIPAENRQEFESQFPAHGYQSSDLMRSQDAESSWEYYKYTEGK